MPAPVSFLMSGECTPFRPATTCPAYDGPHYGNDDSQTFLVADAATGDKKASVRLALWRCEQCGFLLVGIGNTDIPVNGNAAAFGQEFTWLEQASAEYLKPERARRK